MAQATIQLERLTGATPGVRYQISGARVVIGRSAEADIALADCASVSRLHSALLWDGVSLRFEDLGSQNGTVVNGQRTPQGELADGDIIRIGVEEFRVHILRPDGRAAEVPTLRTSGTPQASGYAGGAVGAAFAPGDDAYGVVPGSGAGGETVMPEEVRRRRVVLWKLGAILVVLFGSLYIISTLSQGDTAKSPPVYILKARENRVIIPPSRLWGFDDIIIVSMPVDGEQAEEDIVRWEHYRDRGWLLSDEEVRRFFDCQAVVLKGIREGNGIARFEKKGKPLGTVKIIVRGMRPRELEDLTPEEYARQASSLIEEGKAMAVGQEYEALRRLRRAGEYLARSGKATPEFHRIISDIEKDVSGRLRARIRELYKDCIASTLGSAAKRADLSDAWDKCARIQQLIPDPDNQDWQFAGLVQRMIEALARSRSAKQ